MYSTVCLSQQQQRHQQHTLKEKNKWFHVLEIIVYYINGHEGKKQFKMMKFRETASLPKPFLLPFIVTTSHWIALMIQNLRATRNEFVTDSTVQCTDDFFFFFLNLGWHKQL